MKHLVTDYGNIKQMNTRTPKAHHGSRTFLIRAIILLLFGLFLFYSLFSIAPNLDYKKSLTFAKANPVWPDYGSGAVGAVGFDDLLTKHGDQATRPIASITKIITALVVVDKKPLNGKQDGPNIKLTEADLEIYNQELAAGAAVKPVKVGNVITERQAMEIMLLASSANYAKTLALWAYGSMDEYLKAADLWLKKNGLTQTSVADVSGLSPDSVSTPTDLVSLGELAMKNESLASIVATKQATVSGVGTVYNGNRLLGKDGVNGIKNGLTSEAGACLLFSSVIKVGDKNVTIIGNLLGGEDSSQVAADIGSLISSIKRGFHSVKIISKGQEFGHYLMPWGQVVKLKSEKDLDGIVWSNSPISLSVKADNIKVINFDNKKGIIEAKANNKTFSQPLLISY